MRCVGSRVNISLKGVKHTYSPIYKTDEKGKHKSTFNSYLKRSMKIFNGEEVIRKYFQERKCRISKIINKTISHVEKHRKLKEKAQS